jgi:hypothetical protein
MVAATAPLFMMVPLVHYYGYFAKNQLFHITYMENTWVQKSQLQPYRVIGKKPAGAPWHLSWFIKQNNLQLPPSFPQVSFIAGNEDDYPQVSIDFDISLSDKKWHHRLHSFLFVLFLYLLPLIIFGMAYGASMVVTESRTNMRNGSDEEFTNELIEDVMPNMSPAPGSRTY